MKVVYKLGVVQLSEWHLLISGRWLHYIFITGCNTGLCIGAYIKKTNPKLDGVALLSTDPPCDLQMEGLPVSKWVIWN